MFATFVCAFTNKITKNILFEPLLNRVKIMKINSITTPISFQKKFMTTAPVLKRGIKYDCNIYELDSNEDYDYFTRIKQNKRWNKSYFLKDIIKDFPKNYPTKTTYSIENKKGECIGFVFMEKDEEENSLGIDLIETRPKRTPNSKLKEFKGIGTALINFLIKYAKENEIESLNILAVASYAKGFYKKCGFDFVNEDYIDAKIPSKKYDTVLQKNDKYNKRKTKN